MWFGFKPEEMIRLMRKLGISLEVVDATKVTIELKDGSMMVLDPPESVVLVKSKDQPPVIMVLGEHRIIKSREEKPASFTEDDVRLVAERAGVSLEEARRALEETGGDIAAAILKLTERRS